MYLQPVTTGMCFHPLVDDEEASKPLGDLIRSGFREAAREGLLAAVIVLAVLGVSDTPALLVAGATVGAFALAVLLHQAVLLVGLGVRRLVISEGDAAAGAA